MSGQLFTDAIVRVIAKDILAGCCLIKDLRAFCKAAGVQIVWTDCIGAIVAALVRTENDEEHRRCYEELLAFMRNDDGSIRDVILSAGGIDAVVATIRRFKDMPAPQFFSWKLLVWLMDENMAAVDAAMAAGGITLAIKTQQTRPSSTR